MSNRKFVLALFLFGIVLFLAGIQTGKNLENPKSQTLGEESQPEAGPPLAETSENLYKVLKVIDGDTIDLEIESKRESVRLIGIDAPETSQCFGNESTQKASELLGSEFIILEKDPSQGERDRYRRLLGYIFLKDGTNFSEFMIKNGFAKEYTFRKAYKYQSLFKSAEREAQSQKRGLWQDGVCSTTESKPPANVQNNQGAYVCDCSKLCSQIQTCDEAYYQLNQCGCTKRDSDSDGIPCESLCR